LIRWLEHRAHKLVKEQSSRIHKLAFALLESDRLNTEQIAKVLEQAA